MGALGASGGQHFTMGQEPDDKKITQMKRNVRERFITYEHFYLAEPTDEALPLDISTMQNTFSSLVKIGC